jgi:hypothetical protein
MIVLRSSSAVTVAKIPSDLRVYVGLRGLEPLTSALSVLCRPRPPPGRFGNNAGHGAFVLDHC